MQPQTLTRDIVINVDPNSYSPSGIDLNTNDLIWRKAYALAIPENGSRPDQILVMFGDIPGLPTISPPILPQNMTDTEVKLFDDQIHEALQQGFTVHQNYPQGYFSLLPAATLTPDLLTENESVILPLSTVIKGMTSPLSVARTNLAATTVGSQALFAGGSGVQAGVSGVVDIYNANTQTWTQARLPVARTNLAATSVGNLALFAGGALDPAQETLSNVVDIYNAGIWTQSYLSVARAALAATTVGNLALFAGGRVQGGASDIVDIYNAGIWTQAHLSVARFNLTATTVGNLALFAGGYDALGAGSDVVDIYDVSTQTWTQSHLSVGRTNLAATSLGNHAFFAGGSVYRGVSDVVDIYDAGTQTWTTYHLSVARADLTATTVGNLALFAGGSLMNGVSNVVDTFESTNVVHDNYVSEAISKGQNGQDQVSHLASNVGLSHISRNGSSILTVKNQPGWFIFDNNDEAFLVTSEVPALRPISDSLAIANQQADLVLSYSSGILTKARQFAFTRLTTSAIQQLSQKVFIGGIDYLLTLASQATPELDFSRLGPSNAVNPPTSNVLNFSGPIGLYFQEIFFHIPFLVANTLNTNQRFAEAQKWYHYIFNPTQPKRLVGYWPLDEGTGTVVLDRAGNNNGTFQGTPTWQTVTDFPGVASRSVIQFSGQGNYVSLPPTSLPQGQEITVSFWAFG